MKNIETLAIAPPRKKRTTIRRHKKSLCHHHRDDNTLWERMVKFASDEGSPTRRLSTD